MAIRRLRLTHFPVLAVAALAVAAVISAGLAARAPAVVTWLDVGSPGDEAYTSSFFPPESNADETFRWTSERAELRLPAPGAGRYRLDLRLATVRPEGRTLRAACGAGIHEIDLTALGADSTVPIECRADGDEIALTLDVPIVHLPVGGRALGVSVRDVRMTALDEGRRRAFRILAGLTIFGSLAGTGFGFATLRRGTPTLWLAPGAALTLVWGRLIEQRPDLVLSAVAGPGGLLALAIGLAAWQLSRGGRWRALALVALAATTLAVRPQPLASLVLAAQWTRIEIDALRIFPWLAVIGALAGVALGGRRAIWPAAAGAGVALASIFLPALSAWSLARWSHEIRAPDWTDVASFAGALYVLAAFAIAALAAAAALDGRDRLLARVTLVTAAGIASLLVWRVEVMRFNGDEPHYWVTARSIAVDRDLELLNNYLERRYREATYSPVGNVAASRDHDVNRYAVAVPAGDDAWYLVPPLDDGWRVVDGDVGLARAPEPGLRIEGPNGALAIPPPLVPAERHAIIVEAPCEVHSLAVGVPDGGIREIDVSVLDGAGELLWRGRDSVDAPYGLVEMPDEAGMCAGSGQWAIQVDAGDESVVVEAVDRFGGLQLAGGTLRREWLFAGMPRDRFGSVDVTARLLLHNPSDQLVQVTVRLMTESDLTASEITIGLAPGTTTFEPLPVFGANAVSVRVTEPVEIAAALHAIVDGTRYRAPATEATDRLSLTLAANPKRDAGAWITVVNPTNEPVEAVLRTGGRDEIVEVCPFCATVRHVPAGRVERVIEVAGVGAGTIAPAATVYEERTDQLHFDLGLPLAAAPLTLFGPTWPVLIVTALAGIALAPGLFLLLNVSGLGERTAALAALAGVMLAPVSTYAVRFYTDIVAASLLVWALVLWERGWRSPRALMGMLAIAVALPLLHGRLTLLAVGLGGLALYAVARSHRDALRRFSTRGTFPLAIAGLAVLILACSIVFARYAVALESRGVGNFFSLEWVLPNAFGMLLDRGSGLLPFAPWALFALAVRRPLHRTQRAALLLVLLYYGLLTLRAGGWQTWGSPLRYLLPVIPLLALLALPGAVRLWRSNRPLYRASVGLVLAWSLLVTMLLHWLPLSGYIERRITGNRYLIDDALGWLPGPSPLRYLPTIEALPGPGWGEPLGVVILVLLAASGAWAAWRLIASHPARESVDSPDTPEGALQ